MTNKPDGGSAFPSKRLGQSYMTQEGKAVFTEPSDLKGMTMRQYYAAKAMQGDWSCQEAVHIGVMSNDTPDEWLENRARLYFRMADAMLKAESE